MSINERLKFIREELNLTQAELGARMGRNQSEISKWETGKQALSSEILDDFIKVTNLSNNHLIYLMRGSESESAFGKEPEPIIIREQFEDAEMQRVIDLFENETELRREFSIISNYPNKQRRKLINNMISILKNERE
ncbi:helix-turn-helix domain-containing protein [Heyndrickxia vini]|uniref:Helix-turn-helix domain-containing protein n=1 Tax=Heyndrickxia vini TaxID=1476025 RepID=A0ABX7E3C7_9BACI|nr:helix-turn-helix domain-containing protein [Heyndrickxia vini]QQZ10203.1 helix-turn-helix domain-containing protein [Heyndrickxia vini]